MSIRRASIVAMVTAVIAIPLASHAGEAPAPESPEVTPTAGETCRPADKCCRVCSAGKACGNSCIQASKVCHKGRGCACNESEICSGS